MLDIETMGTLQNSVICSIGAVKFNIATGETGDEFYQRVSIQSCLDCGLQVTGSTIEWWLKQSDKARSEIGIDAKHLVEVLSMFSLFVQDEPYSIWGNPASFDIGIVTNAYEKCNLSIPWNFRLERDMRTLVSLVPDIKSTIPSVGIAHHPIDDCKYQIQVCCATYKHLKLS